MSADPSLILLVCCLHEHQDSVIPLCLFFVCCVSPCTHTRILPAHMLTLLAHLWVSGWWDRATRNYSLLAAGGK